MAKKNRATSGKQVEYRNKGYEIKAGITLAVFAAILAVTDLMGERYAADELLVANEKAAAYQWYQAKSIKLTLEEGQRDTLKALLVSSTIQRNQVSTIEALIAKLDREIDRYRKEKQEILLGSTVVGQDNWAQEIDGKRGQVVGAREWEQQAASLARIGDIFDLAVLFLQLCLVLGAIGIVLQQPKPKSAFLRLMAALGVTGTAISAYGCMLAFTQL